MMNNKVLLSGLIFSSIIANAQVGINTITPTEKADIKGTLRVRSLPTDKQTNAIYTTGADTNSGATPTQTFNASRPLVTDTNGVIGQTTFSDLVPNNTTTNFNTTNTSSAMFVVKRFTVEDTAGGTAGTYSVTGFDTQMDIANWQAFISNISWRFTSAPVTNANQFSLDQAYNYRLQAAGTTWKIIGDIINIKEKAYVDVLFIKSNIVAADSRTQ